MLKIFVCLGLVCLLVGAVYLAIHSEAMQSSIYDDEVVGHTVLKHAEFETVGFYHHTKSPSFGSDLALVARVVKRTQEYLQIDQKAKVFEGVPPDPYLPHKSCNVYDFPANAVYVFSDRFYNHPYMKQYGCPTCEQGATCRAEFLQASAIRLLIGKFIQEKRIASGLAPLTNPFYRLSGSTLAFLVRFFQKRDSFLNEAGPDLHRVQQAIAKHKGEYVRIYPCLNNMLNPLVCALLAVEIDRRDPGKFKRYLEQKFTHQQPKRLAAYLSDKPITTASLRQSLTQPR